MQQTVGGFMLWDCLTPELSGLIPLLYHTAYLTLLQHLKAEMMSITVQTLAFFFFPKQVELYCFLCHPWLFCLYVFSCATFLPKDLIPPPPPPFPSVICSYDHGRGASQGAAVWCDSGGLALHPASELPAPWQPVPFALVWQRGQLGRAADSTFSPEPQPYPQSSVQEQQWALSLSSSGVLRCVLCPGSRLSCPSGWQWSCVLLYVLIVFLWGTSFLQRCEGCRVKAACCLPCVLELCFSKTLVWLFHLF